MFHSLNRLFATAAITLLPSVMVCAQTEECEAAIREIARKLSGELTKRVAEGGQQTVAIAPFFFDLKGSGWQLRDGSFARPIDGEAVNRAAELVRELILDELDDAAPKGCQIVDGNQNIASYLGTFGLPRRFVRDPQAAAEILLLSTDAVVGAVVEPNRRDPTKWSIAFRWFDLNGNAKLAKEDFPVGGQRDPGSLKKEVEVHAEERWGGTAEPEDGAIHSEELLNSWIARHRRAFLASPDVLRVLLAEEKWAAENGHAGMPLMRMLPPTILEPSATRQRGKVEEFAKVLNGTYKALLDKIAPDSYEQAQLKARSEPVSLRFLDETYATYGEAYDAYRTEAAKLARSEYGDLVKRLAHRHAAGLQADLGEKAFWLNNPDDDLSPSLWLDYCQQLECFKVVVAAGKPIRYVPRLALNLTVDVTDGAIHITSQLLEIPSGNAKVSVPSSFSGGLASIVARFVHSKLQTLDDMRGAIARAWVEDQKEKRHLEQRRFEVACYGLAARRYDWYWAPWAPVDPTKLPAVSDIIPTIKSLSDDEVRWWYAAVTGAQ